MPKHRNNPVAPILQQNPGKYRPPSPARMHHRNPSMMPTTGLSEYSQRHSWGMMLELNATGEIKSPSWMPNGTRYLKSRYLTFSAAIQRPGPMLAANASNKKSGKKRICQPGTNRYQHINNASIAKLIKKSMKFTNI